MRPDYQEQAETSLTPRARSAQQAPDGVRLELHVGERGTDGEAGERRAHAERVDVALGVKARDGF